MSRPRPYKYFGKWWYYRHSRIVGASRPCGPFETEEQARASITADAEQTEHAMPLPSVDSEYWADGEMDAVVADPPLNELDFLDTLLAVSDRTGVTYRVRFAADLNPDQFWQTPHLEISLAELRAIRDILALRR